jgi:hypothetical protein
MIYFQNFRNANDPCDIDTLEVKYGKIRFVHLHNYPTFRPSALLLKEVSGSEGRRK